MKLRGADNPGWRGGDVAYRERHREELRAKGRLYYLKTKDEKSTCGKARRDAGRIDKQCEYCGETFKSLPKGRFCSQSCSTKCTQKNVFHRTVDAKFNCVQCGAEFHAKPSRNKKFCSDECSRKWHVGQNNGRWNGGVLVDIVCEVCGKGAKVNKYWTSKRFCSHECSAIAHRGENAYQWAGGRSFEPYCPKFNRSLKEEIRDQFGRRCFLSGKVETKRRFAIHHCDYLKSQGCAGQPWSLLPLDHSWHAKTNHNRWHWFALLRDYWAYKYLTFHGMDIFEGPDRTTWLWEMYNI